MIQIFGDYSEDLPACQEFLTLVFSPSSFPIDDRWGQNGLSADFLSDYFSTFFPATKDEETGLNRKNEVKGAVSYISNELLENAMKFHDDRFPYKISVALQLHSDKLVFLSTNSVKVEEIGKFQAFIQELLTSDPNDMYIRQLENNATNEDDANGSGLGFLTMINDYSAMIGWKFEKVQSEPPFTTVTTMVQLVV